MNSLWAKFWRWFGKAWQAMLMSSLWIVGFGLMISSSGIDGKYLARIMPPFLGYGLNTTSDLASLCLSYWFGKLIRRGVKRAKIVLVFDCILVAYSWFISFLELRITLLAVETAEAAPWVAGVLAGFVPIAIAGVGFTNSLLAVNRRPEKKEKSEKEKKLEFAKWYSLSRRVPSSVAFQVMRRDGAHCFYCGDNLEETQTDKVHIDHFYPRAKGGTDDLFNLVVSCQNCNLSKSDREPTAKEVAKFKIHLVTHSELSRKEQVLLIDHQELLTKQKDIATELSISPSYVSSTLRNDGHEFSEAAQEVCEYLCKVGVSPITQELELV